MAANETNGDSPLVWRKPSDIMKLRKIKLKERKLEKRLGFTDDQDFLTTDSSIGGKSISKTEDVFTNPFRHSPNKRQKLQTDKKLGNSNYDVTLLKRLQDNESRQQNAQFNSKLRLFEVVPTVGNEVDSDEQDSILCENNCLPVDWSLKTSIRLTSCHPFPWSGRVTTPEEAAGVTSFTRCLPLNGGGLFSCQLDTSPNTQLLQCCQVWMHPSLPWLTLFPRQKSKKVNNFPPLDPQLHKSIYTNWCQSFSSLFHLLRARQCPYFYLCADNFTVLFRAAGINSNPFSHALVTPTSSGFRSALTKEGIEFKMPLFHNNGSSKSSEDAELEEGENDDEQTGDWLKSVGVDGELLAKLSQENHTTKKKKENSLDWQPQSLVYVEDNHAHALFNYLLNSKQHVPSWGPLSGVAPTLLAPVAFTGGTLRTLNMQHHLSGQLHMLDMVGPVLPHVPHLLHMLLCARAPNGQFELTLSSVVETTAFSAADEHIGGEEASAPSTFSEQGLCDCGLESGVLQNMCLPLKTGVVSHIHIENGKTVCS